MICWEVTIEIDASVYSQFIEWNSKHVNEIIRCDGFIKAAILKPYEEDTTGDTRIVIIQYIVDSMTSMETYQKKHAPKFRAEAEALFGDKIIGASRRAFTVLEELISEKNLKFRQKFPHKFFIQFIAHITNMPIWA